MPGYLHVLTNSPAAAPSPTPASVTVTHLPANTGLLVAVVLAALAAVTAAIWAAWRVGQIAEAERRHARTHARLRYELDMAFGTALAYEANLLDQGARPAALYARLEASPRLAFTRIWAFGNRAGALGLDEAAEAIRTKYPDLLGGATDWQADWVPFIKAEIYGTIRDLSHELYGEVPA